MRVFVAIDLPQGHKDKLEPFLAFSQREVPYFRWVSEESLHLTLRFVGEAEQSQVDRIDATLQEVKQPKFRMGLRGFGIFGVPQCPQVVWARVNFGLDGICPLATEVTNRITNLGIRFRERALAFQPHVTLGLRRDHDDDTPQSPHPYPPVELEAVLNRLGTWEVSEFVLLESYKEQFNGNPYTRYAVLGRYPLV